MAVALRAAQARSGANGLPPRIPYRPRGARLPQLRQPLRAPRLTLRRLSVSGLNFDRRREWIEQRLIALAQRFAVGLYVGAVMRYQINLVLYLDPGTARHFSDEEVVRCWASLSQTRWAHGGRDPHAGVEIFKDSG